MNNSFGGLAVCAALAMAASAQADVKWTVTGASYHFGDEVINGFFTQNSGGTVIDYSLVSTTFTLNPTNSHSTGVGSDNVSFLGDNGDIVNLVFASDLDVANNPLSIRSSGIYFGGPGPLTFGYTDFAGSATGVTLGVPEPASWALMLGGVFGAGAMLRRRIRERRQPR